MSPRARGNLETEQHVSLPTAGIRELAGLCPVPNTGKVMSGKPSVWQTGGSSIEIAAAALRSSQSALARISAECAGAWTAQAVLPPRTNWRADHHAHQGEEYTDQGQDYYENAIVKECCGNCTAC